MNLFELKTPTVISPDVAFLTKALRSVKSNLLGSGDPMSILNDVLATYNVSFSTADTEDSRVARHDEVGIVRAETDSTGRINIQMERDLRDVFVDDDLWDEFVAVLEEVVGHELIHRAQFADIRAGKDTYTPAPETGDQKKDYRAYLASKYEMMAYAYQAVVEFREAGFKKEAVSKLLADLKNQNPSIQHSAMMARYASFFPATSTEFVKFVALMKAYLEKVPF